MANVALNILRTANLRLDHKTIKNLVPSAGFDSYTDNVCFFKKQNEFNGDDWYFTAKWMYIDAEDLQKLLANQNSLIWCIQAGEGPLFDIIYSISVDKISEKRDVKYAFDKISIEFHKEFIFEDLVVAPKEFNVETKLTSWHIKLQGHLNILTSDDMIMNKYFLEPKYSPKIACDNELPFNYNPRKKIRLLLEAIEPFYKTLKFHYANEELLTMHKNDISELFSYLNKSHEIGYEYFHHNTWESNFDWNFCCDEEYLDWVE